MGINKSLTTLVKPTYMNTTGSSWIRAYLRFLGSRDESVMLKAAPLALMGVLPIDIVSNLIPFVGEVDDLGIIVIFAVVVSRTVWRVRKYR
jgi:uncharacterized membrane protein YkvA (DUF1232 family)